MCRLGRRFGSCSLGGPVGSTHDMKVAKAAELWRERREGRVLLGLRQRSILRTWEDDKLVIRKEHEAAVDELIVANDGEVSTVNPTTKSSVRSQPAAERYEPTCSAHGRRHCEECIAGAPPAAARPSSQQECKRAPSQRSSVQTYARSYSSPSSSFSE